MSTLKVDGIRSNGDTSGNDAITLADNGTCTANITNNLSNRNLIINGAMQVAQRGTSSTTSGYGSVDRFKVQYTGTDEAPTQAQHALTSSDTGPWEKGFRYSYRITNGDQTNNAGAGDYLYLRTELEAQDIANSGWNYTSASDYITLSFWVKSSVAQNFYGYVRTHDGTIYHYPFETGSLTQNQWTKVTKTIPGNANLQFDNNTSEGFQFTLLGLMGTNFTSSGATLNTWHATGGGDAYTPDNTVTWYETNDATLEITGVQLEVSDHATDFEHRLYQDEYLRCCRYYYFTNAQYFFQARGNNSDGLVGFVDTQVPLRNTPSITMTAGLRHWGIDSNSSSTTQPTIPSFRANQKGVRINQTGHSGVNDDCVMTVQTDGNDGQGLAFDAEL